MKVLLPLLGTCLASCASTSNPPRDFALGEVSARPTIERASSPFTALDSAAAPDASLSLESHELLAQDPAPPPRSKRKRQAGWPVGRSMMQGLIGVTDFDDVTRNDGSNDVDSDGGDLEEVPLIGGGGQWKLGGERIDWGLEGLLSIGWRANAEAFAIGGGGAVVAVDVDLLLIDLYGGPFVSLFLGDRFRVYGAVGPLMQWADYSESTSTLDQSGSGFGYGGYARAGLEMRVPGDMLIGLGVRWSESEVDLGSLGDLEIDGLQYVVTFSRL